MQTKEINGGIGRYEKKKNGLFLMVDDSGWEWYEAFKFMWELMTGIIVSTTTFGNHLPFPPFFLFFPFFPSRSSSTLSPAVSSCSLPLFLLSYFSYSLTLTPPYSPPLLPSPLSSSLSISLHPSLSLPLLPSFLPSPPISLSPLLFSSLLPLPFSQTSP